MGYVKASSYFQMNLGFHGEGNISEVYCPCFYLEHSNLSGVGDHQRDRPCPRVGTASGRGRRKKEWKDWAGSGKRGGGRGRVPGLWSTPSPAGASAACRGPRPGRSALAVAEQKVKKLSSVS